MLLLGTSLGTLGERTLSRTLYDVGRRSAAMGPFHLLIYYFVVIQGHHDERLIAYYSGLAVIGAIAVSRFFFFRYGRALLMNVDGRMIWRIFFGSTMALIGLVWGLTCAQKFMEFGSHSSTMLTFAFCLGLSAFCAAAFSFDFVPAVLFQMFMFLPTISILAMKAGDSMALTFAVGTFSFLALMTYTAAGIAKFQISLLSKNEVIERQSRSLEGVNETLRSMFESIDEAFLKFDAGGVCVELASDKSRELLGLDPSGLHLCEILRVPESKVAGIKAWYSMLISERMPFQELAKLGMQTLEVSATGAVLSLKYHPVRDAEGKIRAITLTAANITRQTRAEKKANEAAEKANLVLRIHDNRAGFREFLKQMEETLEHLMRWSGDDLPEVRRTLHTLKGTAALFGAVTLAQAVYRCEMEIRDGFDQGGRDLVRTAGVKLNDAFFSWRNREMDLFLQMGVFENHFVEISRGKMSEMAAKLSGNNRASTFYREIVRELLSSEFGDLWRDFEFHIEKTAQRLGKKVRLVIEREGEEIPVSQEDYREVFRSLIHLVNNAIDHGIEKPALRLTNGKPEIGAIHVTYKRQEVDGKAWIQILFADDGRGINTTLLRRVKGGQRYGDDPAGGRGDSDLEIAQRVFYDGLSTLEDVNEISGQGIGMGSVRGALMKAGGRIRVSKTDAFGTTFEILLPLHSFDGKLKVA